MAKRAYEKYASSAKSVGHWWLRQISKSMKQSDFYGIESPKTESFSGGQFCFVVQTCRQAMGGFHTSTKSVLGIVPYSKPVGFSIWDSLIVQAACRAGPSLLISEDLSHGQSIRDCVRTQS
jgi:hypothetical protein